MQGESTFCLGILDELMILEFKSRASIPHVPYTYFGELGSPRVFHAPILAPQTTNSLYLKVNLI